MQGVLLFIMSESTSILYQDAGYSIKLTEYSKPSGCLPEAQ